MTKKQNEILQFLLKFQTSREDQLIELLNCTKGDIDYLLSNKLIIIDAQTSLLYHKLKGLDIKFMIALDVICRYKKIILNYEKAKFPIIISFISENTTFDIIVAKTIEQSRIFEMLDKISFSDKIIIIIENKEMCDISKINTDREVLICTYPLKVIAKVN